MTGYALVLKYTVYFYDGSGRLRKRGSERKRKQYRKADFHVYGQKEGEPDMLFDNQLNERFIGKFQYACED